MKIEACEHIWNPVRSQAGWRAQLSRASRVWAYGFLNDETLVRRARARDFAAFDALMARYRNRLYSLALGSLGDESEAGEALRDMVLTAFRDIESFGEKCTPGTWLYLHGFRAVFARMKPPAGRYAVERRNGASSVQGD